jgi:hypothetical protein
VPSRPASCLHPSWPWLTSEVMGSMGPGKHHGASKM